MKHLLLLLLLSILCIKNTFAQIDSVSIHTKNSATEKAPTWSNRLDWKFTYWEEAERYYYFYTNGLLSKKSTFSNHYNDTSEIITYTYDNEGYLIRSDYYNIFKYKVMAIQDYTIYERSADKKQLIVKNHTHFDQFDSVILYSITKYKYDIRNQIIHTSSLSFWASDSAFHPSQYHSETRTYLSNKSNKLLERIDSTYNRYTNKVYPTYKYLFVHDQQERLRIILRYEYKDDVWALRNKDSLVYHHQESAPHAYYRINYNSEPNEYFTEMKWYDFKSVNLIDRLFDLRYFQYDLYSYNYIANTSNGIDTVLKRAGNKTDTYGSILYYEYRNNAKWDLRLHHKFVHYYDYVRNTQMYYYNPFDTLSNRWVGMNGSYHKNEYDFQNNITSKYSGNLLGDSFIYHFYKFNYFDYVEVKVGQGLNKKESISFYPNPFSNTLTINTKGDEINTIKIVNTLGQLVYISHPNTPNDTNLLNLSMLDKGIYYLKLTMNNREQIFKIAKE